MNKTKEKLYLISIALLIALCGQFYYSYKYQPSHQVEVYYNQDKLLNNEIISKIREADKYVYFAIYTFTRTDIKDALLAAKYRGLEVIGLTDREQYQKLESQKKIIDELREKGIPIYTQDHSAIMHLKTLVTEKAYVSGSFNWTSSATNSNDEVLEIGYDPKIREKYETILKEIFNRYK